MTIGPACAGAVDELVTDSGLRADQAALGAAVDAMGLGGLLTARAEARTFAADEGVTYGTGQYGSRNWAIDPIPVVMGAAEWTALEAGLRQRARCSTWCSPTCTASARCCGGG